jgi:hypothetical protein
LIATLMLGLGMAGSVAILAGGTRELADELRVRREVLCARYAALAGLALGPSAADRAAAVDDGVESLWVALVLRGPGWCVLRSTGACGQAVRTLEKTVPVAACTG